jgi:endonuclease-3
MQISEKKTQIAQILSILHGEYPDAHCSLNFANPFELLAATIMSAQTTDIRVNKVTQALFARYHNIAEYAAADVAEVEGFIRTVGCFRTKSRNIVTAAQIIKERFNSQVPQTMEELVLLPGVGRKTANVVLSNVFAKPGFAVDTHVKRVAYRLGWTKSTVPEKIEQELCSLIPPAQWGHTSHLLIYHGRAVCSARRPQCDHCPVAQHCKQLL